MLGFFWVMIVQSFKLHASVTYFDKDYTVKNDDDCFINLESNNY